MPRASSSFPVPGSPTRSTPGAPDAATRHARSTASRSRGLVPTMVWLPSATRAVVLSAPPSVITPSGWLRGAPPGGKKRAPRSPGEGASHGATE